MAAAHEERVVRARARVGSVLNDKYRLDRVLGVGGMAAVYSATHLRNASRVAVKLLHPEMAADSNVRARFLREGYAANSVEHPGTVRILDDDTAEDGSVFLVMELLEGETLDHRWERSGHRLGAREVARLMYQVLDVLAAAHAKGIVHRDIKPENLFLTRDGIAEGARLRRRAPASKRPVTATRPGRHHRHAGLHGARAGARQDRRPPVRPLLGGRDRVYAPLEALRPRRRERRGDDGDRRLAARAFARAGLARPARAAHGGRSIARSSSTRTIAGPTRGRCRSALAGRVPGGVRRADAGRRRSRRGGRDVGPVRGSVPATPREPRCRTGPSRP